MPTTGKVTIFSRESSEDSRVCGKPYHWKQIIVVRDSEVAVVEMRKAPIAGWNFDRVTIQGSDAWGDFDHDQIMAWIGTNWGDRKPVGSGFADRVLGFIGRERQ